MVVSHLTAVQHHQINSSDKKEGSRVALYRVVDIALCKDPNTTGASSAISIPMVSDQ